MLPINTIRSDTIQPKFSDSSDSLIGSHKIVSIRSPLGLLSTNTVSRWLCEFSEILLSMGRANKNRTSKLALIFRLSFKQKYNWFYMSKNNQFWVYELILLSVYRYILQDLWNYPALTKTQYYVMFCLNYAFPFTYEQKCSIKKS